MAKSLTEMAADIIAAQASHSEMSPEEISEGLQRTFDALTRINAAECREDMALVSGEEVGEQVPEELMQLRTTPMKSIKRTRVVCLECGMEFKQLTNGHLKDHGLTTKEYRKKYGFAARQPLSAQTLSAKRRRSAKDRNLGEMLKQARQKKKQTAKKTATTKTARGRGKGAKKS